MNAEDGRNSEETAMIKENEKQNHIVKCAFTLYISIELAERVRNAVYWTPGLSVTKIAEEALDAAINRLEEVRGAPFDEREGGIKRGKML